MLLGDHHLEDMDLVQGVSAREVLVDDHGSEQVPGGLAHEMVTLVCDGLVDPGRFGRLT